ncbi:hypothetical protein C3L33_01192, partial [Rhododendron williamsianum]
MRLHDRPPKSTPAPCPPPNLRARHPALAVSQKQRPLHVLKMRSLGDSRLMFDKMPQRNTVSFNVLISAYSRSTRLALRHQAVCAIGNEGLSLMDRHSQAYYKHLLCLKIPFLAPLFIPMS